MAKTDLKDISPPGIKWELLQGWAETHTTKSQVAYPASTDNCLEMIEFGGKNSMFIIPRGGGYTFGDMFLNDGHIVIDTCLMDKIISFDKNTGQIVVQPGVRLSSLLKTALPNNWALFSCPGGMDVTIAGAVSNNVHGKDSWKVGNFGDFVISMKILTSAGEVLTVGRNKNKSIFQAIVGGMGLLGIIVEITLQLQKVPSAFVKVTTTPTKNIEETIDLLENVKSYSDFSIAWIDAFASGSALGRGLVSVGKWVDNKIDLHQQRFIESLEIPTRIFGILPAKPTWYIFRPFFKPAYLRFANAANYFINRTNWGKRSYQNEPVLFTEHNFVHNRIPELIHVFRPYGLIEFQLMFPKKYGHKPIAHALQLCQQYGCQSLLCGVKAHRKDDYLISFSEDGYSISIDLQLRGRKIEHVKKFAGTLLEQSLEYGCKVFLAKDELVPRDIFKQMYPRYKEFLQIKNQMDPSQMFESDMYRRLLKPFPNDQ